LAGLAHPARSGAADHPAAIGEDEADSGAVAFRQLARGRMITGYDRRFEDSDLAWCESSMAARTCQSPCHAPMNM